MVKLLISQAPWCIDPHRMRRFRGTSGTFAYVSSPLQHAYVLTECPCLGFPELSGGAIDGSREAV